jgi:hypothetical protein
MLYFSYGSNMSVRRLLARVPSAQVMSVATLYEHDLCFHKKGKDGSGKCDIHKTGNSQHFVVGVVFEIDENHKPWLDQKEGLGFGYEQKDVMLASASGEVIKAVTYYATHIESGLKPYHWYKHHVLTGAEENELPREYVENISRVESVVDPMAGRHEREMAIYAIK